MGIGPLEPRTGAFEFLDEEVGEGHERHQHVSVRPRILNENRVNIAGRFTLPN